MVEVKYCKGMSSLCLLEFLTHCPLLLTSISFVFVKLYFSWDYL